MTPRVLVMACIAIPAFAGEWETLADLYGPGDLVTIAGNGALTIGTNARGRINLCRWPTPSSSNQLTYEASTVNGHAMPAPEHHGLMWGIQFGEEIIWWTDDRIAAQAGYARDSSIIEIRGRLRGTNLVLRQTLFVDSTRNAFIAHIEASGDPLPDGFVCYANYTPCTRKLSELPFVSGPVLDRLNDFACFAVPSDSRVYHLRPTNPGRDHWEFAETLAANQANHESWATLPEGVYIGVAPLGSRAAPACVPETSIDLTQATHSVAGHAASILRFDATQSATVINAFATNLEHVDAILDDVAQQPYDELLQSRRETDARFLNRARVPKDASEETAALLRRCLLLIATCTDATTGGIVRSPATQPPLARDWPSHGAWVTYALDLAGLREAAEAHLRFYLDAVRTRSTYGQPAGSLPASLHTDGTPASPHVILDVEAVAWLLWSLETHSIFLAPDDAKRFINDAWPRIYDLAEFLASWKDNRRGAPLHAFNPELFHDAQSRRLLTTAHLGMHAAIALAQRAGKTPEPPWTRHAADLDVLMQNLLLDDALTWSLDEPLPLGLPYLDIDPTSPAARLTDAIAARLDALDNLPPQTAARVLAEFAILANNNPALKTQLRERLDPALQTILRTTPLAQAEQPTFPDSISAAQCLIAATLLHD